MSSIGKKKGDRGPVGNRPLEEKNALGIMK